MSGDMGKQKVRRRHFGRRTACHAFRNSRHKNQYSKFRRPSVTGLNCRLLAHLLLRITYLGRRCKVSGEETEEAFAACIMTTHLAHAADSPGALVFNICSAMVLHHCSPTYHRCCALVEFNISCNTLVSATSPTRYKGNTTARVRTTSTTPFIHALHSFLHTRYHFVAPLYTPLSFMGLRPNIKSLQ